MQRAASVFRAPWAWTSASCAASASNLFGAETKGRPVALGELGGDARRRTPGGAFRPVPTAVPPSASSRRCGSAARRCADAVVELRDPARDLLAERERRRVLQVRAADLDDVGQRVGLGGQRVAQRLERRQQPHSASASTAATLIAVGKTSFDDWLRLTSSFGWTSRPSPSGPPRSCEARLASTSFMFMLLCVPEPVCQTESGNSRVVAAGEHLVGSGDDGVGLGARRARRAAVDDGARCA